MIDVHLNICQRTVVVDTDRIGRTVRAVLEDHAVRRGEVSVAVVDDPTIRDLNRSHLEHDYATDVLSYPLSDDDQRLEGEIVISRDTADRNAVEANWAPESELVLYAVHGALHLVGYRDKTPAEARAMRAAEAAALDRLGIARSASDSRWPPASAPATTVGEPTSP